jgi:hypothetical protein
MEQMRVGLHIYLAIYSPLCLHRSPDRTFRGSLVRAAVRELLKIRG